MWDPAGTTGARTPAQAHDTYTLTTLHVHDPVRPVETRARKTESPRCSGSTSSAAAPERTLTRTRAHTNTCTIQLYLRRWLYLRSPQRLSPHVEHVLHIVHPCTIVDSQPAVSNTSAHLLLGMGLQWIGSKYMCARSLGGKIESVAK